jgi:hypothetical protein
MNTFIVIEYGIISWGNSSSSVHFTQREIVRIMADTQNTIMCKSLMKQLQFHTVPCKYILSLENFIINNQKNFQIHPYTVLLKRITTIFTDQTPTYVVFRKVMASKFSTVQHLV